MHDSGTLDPWRHLCALRSTLLVGRRAPPTGGLCRDAVGLDRPSVAAITFAYLITQRLHLIAANGIRARRSGAGSAPYLLRDVGHGELRSRSTPALKHRCSSADAFSPRASSVAWLSSSTRSLSCGVPIYRVGIPPLSQGGYSERTRDMAVVVWAGLYDDLLRKPDSPHDSREVTCLQRHAANRSPVD